MAAECTRRVLFRHELGKLEGVTKKLFESRDIPLDDKYSRWMKKIESAARMSIGKSTVKIKKEEIFSQQVKDLRKQKREIKKRLKNKENDHPNLMKSYREIQEKIRKRILYEKTERRNRQLKKMTEDKTRIIF